MRGIEDRVRRKALAATCGRRLGLVYALSLAAASACAREPISPGAGDGGGKGGGGDGAAADAAGPTDAADATDAADVTDATPVTDGIDVVDAPECPGGRLLYNGRCVLPCTVDADCPARACTTSIGKCLDPPPGCAPPARCDPEVCWGACVEPP